MIEIHSPQSWRHFNLLGEYDFSNDRLQDNTGVLPPKSVAKMILEYWESPTRLEVMHLGEIRKILWRDWYLCWVRATYDETNGQASISRAREPVGFIQRVPAWSWLWVAGRFHRRRRHGARFDRRGAGQGRGGAACRLRDVQNEEPCGPVRTEPEDRGERADRSFESAVVQGG